MFLLFVKVIEFVVHTQLKIKEKVVLDKLSPIFLLSTQRGGAKISTFLSFLSLHLCKKQ